MNWIKTSSLIKISLAIIVRERRLKYLRCLLNSDGNRVFFVYSLFVVSINVRGFISIHLINKILLPTRYQLENLFALYATSTLDRNHFVVVYKLAEFKRQSFDHETEFSSFRAESNKNNWTTKPKQVNWKLLAYYVKLRFRSQYSPDWTFWFVFLCC